MQMTIDEAIALMENEKACILKADTCDRNCSKCELVRKTEDLLSAYDMVIKALERKKWIPCSERQPKENGNYLAFYRTSDGTASLEFMKVDHCNAGGGWLHEKNGRKAYKKVIAWMPLPKPYKAEMEIKE